MYCITDTMSNLCLPDKILWRKGKPLLLSVRNKGGGSVTLLEHYKTFPGGGQVDEWVNKTCDLDTGDHYLQLSVSSYWAD